jgi:hypothetical protein
MSLNISNPITINTPGIYTLQNTDWNPVENQTAIIINSNDVTIDGANTNTTIVQQNTSKNCIFIFVGNHSNIVIKNITLKNISCSCIFSIAENIELTNIKCYNSSYKGDISIKFDKPINIPTNISANFLLSGNNISIKDCQFYNTGVRDSSVETNTSSVYIHHSENLTVNNIFIQGCAAKENAWSIALVSVNNLDIKFGNVSKIYSKNSKWLFSIDCKGTVNGVNYSDVVDSLENLFAKLVI